MFGRLLSILKNLLQLRSGTGSSGASPEKRPSESRLDSTAEEWRREVLSLGLPPVFADVWDDRVPSVLVAWRRPDTFLRRRADLLRYLPRLACCVPLCQEFGDTLFAYDRESDEFVACHFALGEPPYLEKMGDSYQRFVAAYLVNCVYAGEERLEEIAAILNFSHLEKILAFAEQDDDDLDADEAKQQLVASIPKN